MGCFLADFSHLPSFPGVEQNWGAFILTSQCFLSVPATHITAGEPRSVQFVHGVQSPLPQPSADEMSRVRFEVGVLGAVLAFVAALGGSE